MGQLGFWQGTLVGLTIAMLVPYALPIVRHAGGGSVTPSGGVSAFCGYLALAQLAERRKRRLDNVRR